MADSNKKTKSRTARTGNQRQSTQRRNTSSSASRRSSQVKKRAAAASRGGSGFQRDILMLIVIAAAVILMMSALGFGGVVGNAINQVMFGAMGVLFYGFPALLLVLIYLIVSRRFRGRRFGKVLALLILFAFLGGFIQAVTEEYIVTNTPLDYYTLSSLYKTGGGLIGGAVSAAAIKAFGEIGGIIMMGFVILVCVIEITFPSFMEFAYMVVEGIAGFVENRRELYDEGEEERELKREIRDTEKQMIREERRAARMEQLEKRKAELYEVYDDEFDDDDDYEEGPVIGDRKKPARKKNPKVDKFPRNKPKLDVPIYEDNFEDEKSGKIRKAIKKSKKTGFLDGTWLKEDKAKMPDIPDDSPEMREITDADIDEDFEAEDNTTSRTEVGDFTIERGDTPTDDQAEESAEAAPKGRSRKMRTPERTAKKPASGGIAVDEWDERNDDDGGWDEDDALYAMERSASRANNKRKKSPSSDDPLSIEGTAQTKKHLREEGSSYAEEASRAGRSSHAEGSLSTDEGTEEPSRTQEVKAKGPQKNPRSSAAEKEAGIINVANEIAGAAEVPEKKYVFPPLKLLKKGSGRAQGDSDAYLRATAQKLQDTLYNFGVNATVTNVSCGPTVTRFELTPEMGVKVSKIVGLADDIKLNLACADIRIEAPIPGKSAVGIEVPNKENSPVMLRDLLQSDEFQNASSKLAFAVGKDIGGKPVVTDIAKMPHVLIAGATGSGKSVCINTLIMSILYKAKPDEVKMIMIDPKVVELSVYNGIPHLFIPVVTDPKKAAGALNWAVSEMSSRYNTFAEYGVRNLKEYNHKVENLRLAEGDTRPPKMPQIVIIVDELADLMMVAPGDVEDAICRLAQLARAAGIHLVIATQRPSVNVITGLIKANMPSRIAFAVASGVDSRTILDMNGAEKLLGKGDMLFYPQGYPKPARLQGSFVSDEEVSAVVEYLTNKNPKTDYDPNIQQQMNSAQPGGSFGSGGDDRDAYFAEAGKLIIDKDKASIGMLQRMFKIGFNRAARIMDQLADAGVVGPEEGTKPRKVLMSPEQFENYLEENG